MVRAHVSSEESPILEAWYRTYLPKTRFDISASGVQAYRFGALRTILGLGYGELDSVLLEDSLTLGGHAVRRAIADRYAGGDSARVLVTHGSSEAIALMMQVLFVPGDRVVIADPIYHSLRTFPERQGCAITRVPVERFVESGESARGFDEQIRPGTKAVIVNFPHNPTGATLNAASIRKLISRTEEIGAKLLWDAAMEELPMDPADQCDTVRFASDAIRFGTLSKAFGLPGLRVGWCIAPPALLERTLPLRDRTTLFLSPLVELIAARAIEQADKLIEPRLMQARNHLNCVDDFILRHEGRLAWQRPRGGVCGMVEICGVRDTRAFCEHLLQETGVLLVPGSAFECPSQVRIGYGGDTSELHEGLELLSGFLRRST
jgi:capreomycidine synthase